MVAQLQAPLTSRWTPLRPHTGQQAAWTCSKRFVGLPCGRGSGKTELAKRRLVRFLPIVKPWAVPRYFYSAPTVQQAKRLAWDDLLRLIPPEWLAARPHISDLRITTIFGSELWIIGMDRPERIEGNQWDGGILDESSDIKAGAFAKSIIPALTWRNGWVWRIGVPKRQGPGAAEYRKFCELGHAGTDSDTAAFSWPSSDIISSDQLAYARSNLDPKDYREQFDASWETVGGGIFYAFDREYNVRPCGYQPNLPILVGSDFNVDPMAWVLAHRLAGRLEVFDEVWMRNTNTPATLDALAGRYPEHKGWEFYGDASGNQRRTSASRSDIKHIYNHPAFKTMGRTLHFTTANPPVVDRFAATNAMFCNAAGERRLFIDPRCSHLIDDLEARYFKPGTREAADSKDLGHATDALGYIVFRLYPIRLKLDHDHSQGRVITTRGAR